MISKRQKTLKWWWRVPDVATRKVHCALLAYFVTNHQKKRYWEFSLSLNDVVYNSLSLSLVYMVLLVENVWKCLRNASLCQKGVVCQPLSDTVAWFALDYHVLPRKWYVPTVQIIIHIGFLVVSHDCHQILAQKWCYITY